MKGLTEQEAGQKLQKNGLNEIPLSPPVSWWKLFFAQYTNFVVIILLVAGVFSILIKEYIDASFIFLIVICNSLLGLYQELKAQKDIRSLRSMVNPTIRVIRDGVEKLLPAKYLVPGDLAILGAGDKIPADCILHDSVRMSVNEAVLTGESIPVEKIAGDTLLMATTVLSGHGKVRITLTGQNSNFGKLAQSLVDISDEKTQLEQKIEKFGRKLGIFIIIAGIIFFVAGIARGLSISLMFLQTVSLVVAVIPEGLTAVFTITMAVGVQRMAKKKAILRRLSASEGLGCVNIICTDKTGTLTKNEMTVKEIWLARGSEYKAGGVGYTKTGEIKAIINGSESTYQKNGYDAGLTRLIEIGVLCNSSSLAIKEGKDNEYDVLGDTTEGSLLIFALKAGEMPEEIKSKYQILDEYSFDSQRMMMSVLTKTDSKTEVMTKGAPEKVLEVCDISPEEKKKALQKLDEMSRQGLRVLAMAYKELLISNNEFQIKKEEDNLKFIGLVGIYDPPRAEVRETIQIAGRAGVRTVMLTGDNPLTAAKVAQEIGLYQDGDEIITSEQLNTYTDEIFNQKLDQVNVFARINPLDKLKIVTAFQRKNMVVGVTGDGINDAPALKKADIGIAMGITGTDVAKESADIVITDDNYSTIIHAIEEGRVIYDNILKAIKYLISSNLGESLTVVSALALGWPIPLIPQQILWINLVSDGMPALAMAVDPKDPEIMTKMPRDKDTELLTTRDWKQLFLIGMIEAIITLFIFKISLLVYSQEISRLISFTALVVLDLTVVFVIRGKRQSVFNNKALIFAVGSALLAQIVIISVPGIRQFFM